jgi:calcineurin-like phosphoesterase family protein
MIYHSVVEELTKDYPFPCFLAFCFIFFFFLFSGFYIMCYADSNEHDPFMSKTSQKSNFNFVTAGDFGCGDEPNKTINGMIKKNPELVIALGDLSYEGAAACWINSISLLNNDGRVKIAFGEHDITQKMVRYNTYMNHFNLTKPYYSFNHQNVHFLAMATAKNAVIPYRNGSEQYNFIQEDLKNAHNNKSIDWIIVYTFRPLYSSVTEHYGDDVLPTTYHRLFDKYGVDVVLQAHNHNYQRTFPLRYNESSNAPQYNPIIADIDKAEYKDPNGRLFLTVGTGGAEVYNFTAVSPYVVQQLEGHGFLNVDINSTSKESILTGTFIENTDMNKKDQFSIIKQK